MYLSKTNYDRMSYREIRFALRRDGIPEREIETFILSIRMARRQRSNEKRSIQERNKRWGEVIAALQHERRIVRGMVRYKTKTPAPERDEFVEKYYRRLTKLYEELLEKKNLEKILPEHEHWTDFVPDEVKEMFIKKALAVPQRDKSKFKEPFQRTSPMALTDLRRGRLLRYTRSTLDTLLERLDNDPENPKLQRKEWLLREAIKRISAMPKDAHIPNHWADVVQDLLHPDDDTEMASKVKQKQPKKRAPKTPKNSAPGTTITLEMLKGQLKAEMQRRDSLKANGSLRDTLKNFLSNAGMMPTPDEDDET